MCRKPPPHKAAGTLAASTLEKLSVKLRKQLKINNMYKKMKYFIALVLLTGCVITTAAQTIIFNESLTTQSSFNKFTAVSIKGAQVW